MFIIVAQLVKNPPAKQETLVQFLGQKIPWRMGRLPTVVLIFLITRSLCLFTAFIQFPWASLSRILGSAGKESACNVGDLGSTPGLGRSPGEGNGYPVQYFGLENSIDCIAYGVAKSPT